MGYFNINVHSFDRFRKAIKLNLFTTPVDAGIFYY